MQKYGQLVADISEFAILAEKVYGPYKRPTDGRSIVIIKDDAGKSRTVSYPKYLMEQHLSRKLLPNETVDHWDSNIDNNDLDNLKVIDRAEHSKQDTRRVKNIKLKCSLCQKEFERSPRLLRDKSKKGSGGPFCSRQCSGKYNRLVQLKQMDKLPAQDYVESEYYKAKYTTALVNYLLTKYAAFVPDRPVANPLSRRATAP